MFVMSGMERRNFHGEQLSGLLLPHKVHLSDITLMTSSQHFEAPGTYLHLHKQTNRCIEAITRIRRNRRNADVPT